MAEEIKQRISLDNADIVEAQLKRIAELEDQLARAQGRVGDESQQAAPKIDRQADAHNRLERESEQATAAQRQEGQEIRNVGSAADRTEKSVGALAGAKNFLATSIAGMVTGLMGAMGLHQALQTITDDMDKLAAKSREMAEVGLNLHFLQNEFDPGERAFVRQAAVSSGRDPIEVTRSYADLRSRFPGESKENLQALMMEIGETAQTTDAPLAALTNMFSTIYQFERDPNKAQNILRESGIQAGVSDPAVLAPLMARFMGIGRSVGLDPAESAGAVAASTGMGLSPEVATTGLTNVALALQGKGTPGGAEILKRLGIQQGGNFFDALTSVSQGSLSTAELEMIFGREGLPVASQLSDPGTLADFMAKVQAVRTAGTTNRDLTAEAIAAQFAADPMMAENQRLKQEEAALAAELGSNPDAMVIERVRIAQERRMRESGYGPLMTGLHNTAYRMMAGAGVIDAQNAEQFLEGGGVSATSNATLDLLFGNPYRDISRNMMRGRQQRPVIIGQQYIIGPDGESPLTRRPERGGP